ncbi:type II secretion system protein [Coprothermobacteraceae bacterium]|nr:type II secretion system protein [Coprothermobacteraceae bacterium]
MLLMDHRGKKNVIRGKTGKSAKGGFTLIELLVAFLIVGLLAAGMLPALASISKQSYHAEVASSIPSVVQKILNTLEPDSVYNPVYENLAPPSYLEMPSAPSLYLVTASTQFGDYSYKIGTLKSIQGIGGGTLVPEEAPTTVTAPYEVETPTTIKITTASAAVTWMTSCEGQTDPVSVYSSYIEIKPGSDKRITYNVAFMKEATPNYIVVALAGGASIKPYYKQGNEEHGFLDAEYWTKEKRPGAQQCSPVGQGGVGNMEVLSSVSSTLTLAAGSGSGAGKRFKIPDGGLRDNPATYRIYAQHEGKVWWNVYLDVEFTGTPTDGWWARIYVPTTDVETTTTATVITPTVTIFTYPYTPEEDFIEWESVTFTVLNPAHVNAELWVGSSQHFEFAFVSTGALQQFTVPIRFLALPKGELQIKFTIKPDTPAGALVTNIVVWYWKPET